MEADSLSSQRHKEVMKPKILGVSARSEGEREGGVWVE